MFVSQSSAKSVWNAGQVSHSDSVFFFFLHLNGKILLCVYDWRHSQRDSFAFMTAPAGRWKGLRDTQGAYMLMHIHTLKHNTATLNFLTNHRADGSASLCLASYKQKRQHAVFASHSSSVSHILTHTNTSPQWIAGAIKRQQHLTCPWKPNRRPKTHINICTSAVATMSKRSLYYMLQHLCLEMTALSCGGGPCKVPVCLPKWPLTCKPHTEMYTQCLACFPESCSSQRKLHSL